MAGFPHMECLSLIKNDAQIPILYMEVLWQKKVSKKAICMFQSLTAIGSPFKMPLCSNVIQIHRYSIIKVIYNQALILYTCKLRSHAS